MSYFIFVYLVDNHIYFVILYLLISLSNFNHFSMPDH